MGRSIFEFAVSMSQMVRDYSDKRHTCVGDLTKNPDEKADSPMLNSHTKIDRPYPGFSSVNAGWSPYSDRR